MFLKLLENLYVIKPKYSISTVDLCHMKHIESSHTTMNIIFLQANCYYFFTIRSENRVQNYVILSSSFWLYTPFYQIKFYTTMCIAYTILKKKKNIALVTSR